MRRGSIQTFESLARRQSNMSQIGGNRTEFTASDVGLNDIEYERKGGFFMSHKKTALVVSAVVVIVIAAGFVGAYIGSIPKEKVDDALTLIDGDIGCDERVASSRFSLSDAIRPSRYLIELSPILEDDPITRLRGRIVVEFHHNASSSLGEIVLNARKINVTGTKLVSVVSETIGDFRKSRRRRNPEKDEIELEGDPATNPKKIFSNESTEVLPKTSDPIFLVENRTIGNENTSENLSENSTSTKNLTDRYDVISSTETNSSLSSLKKSPNYGNTEKNESVEIAINRIEVDDEGGFVVLYLSSHVQQFGNYLLEIDYEVSMNGYEVFKANRSKSSYSKKFSSGRLNPTKIRNYFPVFDDPRMKARFSLTMPITMGMIIHSNMPVKNTTEMSDEWVLVSFEETPPISPDNLVVAETTHVEILGERNINETLSLVVMGDESRQGSANYLIEKIVPATESLFDLFGLDLSIEKLNVIGVDDAEHNSGNLGLVTIQDSIYKVDDQSPEVTKEEGLMSLIELLGQQWLGGLVGVNNSTDAWILKSSLLYLRHYLKPEIDSNFSSPTFFGDVQSNAMEVDGYSVSRSLESKLNPTNANSFYIHEVNAMGACLIRMLHGALRRSEFRAGYRSFVTRWNGKNADVGSFWKAMTFNSTEDEEPEGEVSLPEVMNLWTKEGGYPVVTVTRNYETGSAVVRQARFTYDKPSSVSKQLWHIPLNWITQNRRNGSSEVFQKWMKPQVEVTLKPLTEPGDNRSWVIFNPTKSGYYRVNYDNDTWNLLARALQEDHEIFSPETRASLVDDAFSLAFVGLVPYSIVFDLIDYIPDNEMDSEPWGVLLHHAIKLNLALYDSPAYSSYQKYMVNFISDLYVKVGNKIVEGHRLTRIVHRLACMFDYPHFFTWAKRSYVGFENSSGSPINENVPAYLHDNFLCAFAKSEHELGWQWWQQKFTNVTNVQERVSLLSSLACFQVPWMLQAVLNDIVYSTNFDEADALVILESFSNYPAASQTALQFVESNWKDITRRYPKSCKVSSAFLDASSTGFTGEKDVEDFQSFKAKNHESLKKVGHVTALLEAKANACVSFLQTSLPEFRTSIANRTTFSSESNNEEIKN